jgi:hypothetical protein
MGFLFFWGSAKARYTGELVVWLVVVVVVVND